MHVLKKIRPWVSLWTDRKTRDYKVLYVLEACFTPSAAEGLPHMWCRLHAEVEDSGNARPNFDNISPAKLMILQWCYYADQADTNLMELCSSSMQM